MSPRSSNNGEGLFIVRFIALFGFIVANLLFGRQLVVGFVTVSVHFVQDVAATGNAFDHTSANQH